MGARHDDDAELVLAAQAGDQQAFSTLFERWFDRSYDVAWRIVRNRDTAAEVAQDTFLAAWQGLDGLRDPAAFGGWVLRTARNRALNRLEREGRSRAVDPGDAADALDAAPVGVVASSEGRPGGDPADAVARDQQVALVWEAAEALGERELSLLDLHLRHGLEPAEIAEALDVTPNNAHQLLFRLRKKLGGAVRARVLWRGGDPRCDELARALFGAGVTSFDAKAVKVIDAHAEACPICSQARALATSPEALFAATPLLAAPAGVRQAVVEALRSAGVPLDPGAATPAPTGGDASADAPSPEHGVGDADAPGQPGGATDPPPDGTVPGAGPDAGGATGSADPTVAMAGVTAAGDDLPPTSPTHAPPGPGGATPGPADDDVRSGRAPLVIGLVVVLLLLAGGVGWLVWRDGGASETVAAAQGPDELEAVGSTTSTTRPTTTTSTAPTTTTSAAPTTTTTTAPPSTTTTTTAPPRPSTTATTTPPAPTPPPPAPPAAPTIDRFTVADLGLGGGGCQSFQGGYQLTWATTAATATALSGPGAPAGGGAPDGTTVLCLGPPAPSPSTVSWTLTATGPGGTAQQSATPP